MIETHWFEAIRGPGPAQLHQPLPGLCQSAQVARGLRLAEQGRGRPNTTLGFVGFCLLVIVFSFLFFFLLLLCLLIEQHVLQSRGFFFSGLPQVSQKIAARTWGTPTPWPSTACWVHVPRNGSGNKLRGTEGTSENSKRFRSYETTIFLGDQHVIL